MNDYHYFQSMAEKGLIRMGARAIITNSKEDKFLVEKNRCEPTKFFNFVGGGLDIGETLDECLKREILEETSAGISRMEYLFYVENFITYKTDIIHGIGFYYLLELERHDIKSANKDYEFLWYSQDELPDLDLRPYVVRDCIIDGSYQSINRLISRDNLE